MPILSLSFHSCFTSDCVTLLHHHPCVLHHFLELHCAICSTHTRGKCPVGFTTAVMLRKWNLFFCEKFSPATAWIAQSTQGLWVDDVRIVWEAFFIDQPLNNQHRSGVNYFLYCLLTQDLTPHQSKQSLTENHLHAMNTCDSFSSPVLKMDYIQ